MKAGLVLVVLIGILAVGASWSIIQPQGQGISQINAETFQDYIPSDFLQVAGDKMEGDLNMTGNDIRMHGGNITSSGDICIGNC